MEQNTGNSRRNLPVYSPWAALAIAIFTRSFLRQEGITEAGNAIYLAPLIGLFFGVLFWFAVLWMSKRSGGLYGKGKLRDFVKVIVGIAFLTLALESLRNLLDVVETFALTTTPRALVALAVIGLLGGALRKGSQALFRAARIIFLPFCLLFLLLLILSLNGGLHTQYLFPVLGDGSGALLRASLYESACAILVLYPFIVREHIQKPELHSLVAILSGLLLTCAGYLVYAMITPYTLIKGEIWPLQQLTAYTDYTQDFQRLRPLLIWIWSVGFFIQFGLYWREGVSLFSEGIALPDDKPLLWPTALTIGILSLPRRNFFPEWFLRSTDLYPIAIGALALVLLLLGLFRKRGTDLSAER